MTAEPTPEERPGLRIVRGDPTPEEVAALVAVIGARAAGSTAPPSPARSAWGDPARAVRRSLHPGPDGWRASGRPL
jgi:hypothetical protein